jgi:hypothetical protein
VVASAAADHWQVNNPQGVENAAMGAKHSPNTRYIQKIYLASET